MAGDLCPFCGFQACRSDCNFYNSDVEGCVIDAVLLSLVTTQHGYLREKLEKIEQYLLDASNSLIDINYNTR